MPTTCARSCSKKSRSEFISPRALEMQYPIVEIQQIVLIVYILILIHETLLPERLQRDYPAIIG